MSDSTRNRRQPWLNKLSRKRKKPETSGTQPPEKKQRTQQARTQQLTKETKENADLTSRLRSEQIANNITFVNGEVVHKDPHDSILRPLPPPTSTPPPTQSQDYNDKWEEISKKINAVLNDFVNSGCTTFEAFYQSKQNTDYQFDIQHFHTRFFFVKLFQYLQDPQRLSEYKFTTFTDRQIAILIANKGLMSSFSVYFRNAFTFLPRAQTILQTVSFGIAVSGLASYIYSYLSGDNTIEPEQSPEQAIASSNAFLNERITRERKLLINYEEQLSSVENMATNHAVTSQIASQPQYTLNSASATTRALQRAEAKVNGQENVVKYLIEILTFNLTQKKLWVKLLKYSSAIFAKFKTLASAGESLSSILEKLQTFYFSITGASAGVAIGATAVNATTTANATAAANATATVASSGGSSTGGIMATLSNWSSTIASWSTGTMVAAGTVAAGALAVSGLFYVGHHYKREAKRVFDNIDFRRQEGFFQGQGITQHQSLEQTRRVNTNEQSNNESKNSDAYDMPPSRQLQFFLHFTEKYVSDVLPDQNTKKIALQFMNWMGPMCLKWNPRKSNTSHICSQRLQFLKVMLRHQLLFVNVSEAKIKKCLKQLLPHTQHLRVNFRGFMILNLSRPGSVTIVSRKNRVINTRQFLVDQWIENVEEDLTLCNTLQHIHEKVGVELLSTDMCVS